VAHCGAQFIMAVIIPNHGYFFNIAAKSPDFGDSFKQRRCRAAFAFGENEPGRLVYDRRCT